MSSICLISLRNWNLISLKASLTMEKIWHTIFSQFSQISHSYFWAVISFLFLVNWYSIFWVYRRWMCCQKSRQIYCRILFIFVTEGGGMVCSMVREKRAREGGEMSRLLELPSSKEVFSLSWMRSFLRERRSSMLRSLSREILCPMDLVSCCASAKPTISLLLKDWMLSISTLKDSSFFLSSATADAPPPSLSSPFTRSMQANRSSQSLVQCGMICSEFSAIFMSMALSCVSRSSLIFISSFSLLALVHSASRVWFLISISIFAFLQDLAISLILIISFFKLHSSRSQSYILFSSSRSFSVIVSAPRSLSPAISRIPASISSANRSMTLLCFSPVTPVLLLALSRLMFFWCIFACEVVFCINEEGIITLQFFRHFLPMIDFNKIYCKEHPYELINNFCTDRNCLVGLCPTCVCEHTDMHIRNKTQPQFQNIRATFTRVHEEIQGQIEVISKDKERLASLVGAIREKKSALRGVLQKAREDCLRTVKEHFDELEKTWENSISCEEKKHSLHSAYRLDTLNALISKEISELIDESRRMNSIAFVEEVPRITKEALVESRAFHSRISEEFQDNEKYTPIISYNSQNLKEVTLGLKKLLTLQFSIPVKKYLSSSASTTRVSSVNFKQEAPKESLSNFSMVVKRQSVEKTAPQPLLHSSLFSVPMVLTTSYVNTPTKTPMPNQSQFLQKSRMSKISFTPSYIDRVQPLKHSKPQTRSQLKHKKSGLTLSGREEIDSAASQKQNSRR